MKPWGIVALLALVLVGVAGTAGYVNSLPPGNSSTDDSAENTAHCLAKYPVPDTAARFTARAQDVYSGCGGTEVLEATDIGNRLVDTEEPSARLVLLIDMPGHQGMFSKQDPVTACYQVEFNYFGLDNGPDRIDCPQDPFRPGIPDGYENAFKAVLAELPPTPAEEDVRKALQAKLPPLPVNAKTGTTWPAPDVRVYVAWGVADIGISADARRGRCLQGTRLADGTVTVWFQPPPSPEAQGMVTCTPENAVDAQRRPK
ncbi:hypothetical protein JNUCC0626_45395 [Lentzea sp. JNUCC 0626]|uniref:hypothetical protein n=1 Tax=Lentzea sp. JNUCC 0626 TaxID=3367513 RepID=UPI0037480C84